MSKLFKLKEWLNLDDCEKYLTTLMGEDVTKADILRLGLDGHLILSVHLVNQARVRVGKIIPKSQANPRCVPSFFDKEVKQEIYDGILIKEDKVLQLEDRVVTIDGVWDLPMLGAEALDVEHEYQNITEGPSVTLGCIDGPFVMSNNADNSVVCQIQGRFDKEDLEQMGCPDVWFEPCNPKGYFPADCLPSDSVFVVRTAALREFERSLSEPKINSSHPKRENEKPFQLIKQLVEMLMPEQDLSKSSQVHAALNRKLKGGDLVISEATLKKYLSQI